jgi:hypothetical protein
VNEITQVAKDNKIHADKTEKGYASGKEAVGGSRKNR